MNTLKNTGWYLILWLSLSNIGCHSAEPENKPSSANTPPTHSVSDTVSLETMKDSAMQVKGSIVSNNTVTTTSTDKSLPIAPVTVLAKGSKTYFDKVNNVSLQYPENWIPDYNKYVAFKINSPQENEKDSIQENFFYAVVEENPPTKQVIQQQPAPTILTIDQMATKMQRELTMESENRKQCKVVSSHKFVLNGVPAYEFISTGIIKGIAMKYRIIAMKLGTKQYYLYFSAEQNNYDRYQQEANMIFNSFLVK